MVVLLNIVDPTTTTESRAHLISFWESAIHNNDVVKIQYDALDCVVAEWKGDTRSTAFS
jgi:hypothetical protein